MAVDTADLAMARAEGAALTQTSLGCRLDPAPPAAFLHLIGMVSIDGTQELLLFPIADNCRCWSGNGMRAGQLFEELGAGAASQLSLQCWERQSHVLKHLPVLFSSLLHWYFTVTALKIRQKIAKDFPRTWMGHPNDPSARKRKNNRERGRAKKNLTSSTKLLLLNSLGQLQVGHKDVCIFRIKSLIGWWIWKNKLQWQNVINVKGKMMRVI